MVEQTPLIAEKAVWRAIGRSVRGAAHKRAGLPNQDSIRWWPESGEGLPIILAASDGHGSAKYFRSGQGALLAVETAIEVMAGFLRGQTAGLNGQAETAESTPEPGNGQLDLSTVIDMAEVQLPKLLTRRWLEKVEKDIEERQLDPKELERLEENDEAEAAAVKGRGKATPLAYGATLLAVAVTESFIIYTQIGDGDILAVSEAEEVYRPIEGDERLIANETTSLCAKNAWSDFRVKVQPTIDALPPTLILVSTDGYANSFKDEKNFLQIGPDLLRMVYVNGLDGVDRRLEAWLNESSQTGSGDDITLGILKRSDGNDLDGVARAAGAALATSHENHARLDSIAGDLTSTKESLGERFEKLEGSLASVGELKGEIAALHQGEANYRRLEMRLRRLSRMTLLGFLVLVTVEILAHLFWPSGAPATQQAQPGVTAAVTPAPTVQASPSPSTEQASPSPSPEGGDAQATGPPNQAPTTVESPKPTPRVRPTPRASAPPRAAATPKASAQPKTATNAATKPSPPSPAATPKPRVP